MTRRPGFSVPEFALVVGLMGFAFMMIQPMLIANQKDAKDQAAAQQLAVMLGGVQNYVSANSPALVTAAAGGPVTLTVAMLTATGMLQPSFQATNAYGQTMIALTRLAAPGRLETLVYTAGGTVIDEGRLPAVAAIVGQAGGIITARSPNQATGSYGGWAIALAPYTAAATAAGFPLTTGHLAATTYFNATLTSSYLSRLAVPGDPAATQMEAPIDMNGNAIANAGTVTASEVVLSGLNNTKLTTGVFTMTEAHSGDVIAKPSCPSGETAQIFTAISTVSPNGSGSPMAGINSWAQDNGNGTWSVYLQTDGETGWVFADAAHGAIQVSTKCS